MHFLQYPGNWEGDFPIPNSTASSYVASRSDGKLMQGLTVPIGFATDNKTANKKAPIVFFGGNAQGMSGAAQDAIWLFGTMSAEVPSYRFQLFSTAYRGFKPNSGFVTQAGLTKDAQDFLEHALNSTHGSLDGRIILGGWSMGAGVAIQLAAAMPEHIAGLVVFSPWSSLREETLNIWGPISHLLYPWIWLTEVWDSVAAVSSLPADIPVAVVSAGSDMVIKPWEHRKVYEASHALQKWWLQTPGANHPDLPQEIITQKEELERWTAASWKRVQKFGESKSTARAKPALAMSIRSRAFTFFGEAFDGALTRMHELFLV